MRNNSIRNIIPIAFLVGLLAQPGLAMPQVLVNGQSASGQLVPWTIDTSNGNAFPFEGPIAAGSPQTANPVPLGGVDPSGNAQHAQVDSTKALMVDGQGLKPTYSAASWPNLTGLGANQDFFVITGSATKTIRITRVEVWVTGNGVTGTATLNLYKRSTADTGGTATSVALVAHDSADVAATAAATSYAGTWPTSGTGSLLHVAVVFVINAPSTPVIWTFGNPGEKPVILRGISQSLAIQFGSSTIPANASVIVTETEE